jgi:prephenate dehydratase
MVMGLPGTPLGAVRRVLSHPVALAQCGAFFAAHPGIDAVAFYDTAGAARAVADGGDPAAAAIAGRGAAERYGLAVLAAHVEDRADNQTRFLVVAPPGAAPPPRPAPAGLRTTLVAETPNAPGMLVRLLAPLAERGINLSKLESRPAAEPWTYRFFLEFEGGAEEPAARDALARAARHATSLRVLGSYPRWAAAPEEAET